jgi:PEP-CTERM motif
MKKEKIMSLSKSLSVVFAFSLLAHADTLISTSGNFAGGGINNTQANVNGGALPAAGGNYNLQAFAHDSLVNPDVDNKSGPKPYVITPQNPNGTDSRTADANGVAFDAYSLAQINYSRAGGWNSAGSYASVCGPASAASPQGNKANCGKNPNGEDAKALAQVRDPWSFNSQSTAFTFDNFVTFSAGLSLQALATSGDFAQASILADGSTDLNGLGELWTFSWSTNSTAPGVSGVNFWSNPALGLNDALIGLSFEQLLSGDASTGLSTLTQSFSFDYQLTIPANTIALFSSSVTYDAAGVTGVPEPSSLVLGLMGASLLIAGRVRRKRRSRYCS